MNRLRTVNVAFKRFQSHAAHAETKVASTFTNKFNYNIDPPQVHEYWNIRNTSVLLAFIPIFFTVTYLTRSGTDDIRSFESFYQFAQSEESPLKKSKFGQPQLPEQK